MKNEHLLIIGAGSVGKRHARNFRQLGFQVSGTDPREDRRDEFAREFPGAGTYADLEAALKDARFAGVVICSPPSFHVDQARASLEAGMPILLEKPVCPDVRGGRELESFHGTRRVPLLLGYTWRWWPPLRRVRELLDAGAIGALRHVRFVMSAHLGDWHPWERYQDFFMASRAQGGGALLDESHWIDLACWMFGMPDLVSAQIDKLSDLEIDTDDNVDLCLSYGDRLRVTLHLDLFGRPHEKSITFVGEGGTLRWTADPNEIRVGTSAGGWEQCETFSCERNDMFVAVAKEFAGVLKGGAPSCTLQDGIRVLEIIHAARVSHAERRAVAPGDAGR